MKNETTVDPLQLVPHRIKALKLIYGTYRGAGVTDNQTTYVSTSQQPLTEFTTRRSDDFDRTTHVGNTDF